MMRGIVGGVVREGFGRLRIIVNYVHDFLGDAKGGIPALGILTPGVTSECFPTDNPRTGVLSFWI
jgi:hypothetical protein